MRFVLGVLFSPFRLVAWVIRRLYVRFRGYNVLEIRIAGRLSDRKTSPGLLGAFSGEPAGTSLLELLSVLERVERDERIAVVHVELGSLTTGLARAEELQRALVRVRNASKHVVVQMEEGGLASYFIALGGSEIVLPPSGGLNVTGVASEVTFFKGLLDHVGVRAWMRARGKYKSARETFAESEMSPANREMTESLVGDLHGQLVTAIARERKLERADVEAKLNEGPFMADDAKRAGFIDRVLYPDELDDEIEAKVGKVRALNVVRYMKLSTHLARRGKPTTIALLEVAGPIKSGASVSGTGGRRATGARRFAEDVEAFAKEPRVKAIVLRVDSPGGSALASDLMWRALAKAAEKKPVIVSMADVAASGGYFVSGIRGAPIFASASTVTGSIGVLSGKFEASALYEKLGIKKELIAVGKRAAFFSDSRGFSEDEVAKLESDLDAHYRLFLSRMADGRGKTIEEIHEVAQGRVWTGKQALEVGLVDAEGGLFEALAKTRSLLGLSVATPLALVAPRERRRFPVRLAWRGAESVLPEALLAPLRFAEYFGRERMLALLPFDIRFE
jgi:protease-4